MEWHVYNFNNFPQILLYTLVGFFGYGVLRFTHFVGDQEIVGAENLDFK